MSDETEEMLGPWIIKSVDTSTRAQEGRRTALARPGVHGHGLGMFVITEADAAAIRAIFNEEGELSAAIELRRRFPGVSDNAKARDCARTIAGWTRPPEPQGTVTRLDTRKNA